MAKKTMCVVLGKVAEWDRADLENIAGMSFKDVQAVRAELKSEKVMILEWSDFMNECNNEDIVLSKWWMTFVWINQGPSGQVLY